MILKLLQRFAMRVKASRVADVVIGGKEHPYLLRWHVIPRNRLFNIYLHEFYRSDDDRALHDHPWWWCSILVDGSYTEVTNPFGAYPSVQLQETYVAGSVRFHRASFAHRLVIEPGARCTTLFITGPRLRIWGFHCPKGWVPWNEFTDPNDTGAIGAGCGEEIRS